MSICLTTGNRLDAHSVGAWAGPDSHVCHRRRADIPPAAPHTETVRCGSLRVRWPSQRNPPDMLTPVKTGTTHAHRGPTRGVRSMVQVTGTVCMAGPQVREVIGSGTSTE